MVRKLFALASVSALAGVVSVSGAAGCSESAPQQGPSDSGAGAGDAKAKDSGKPTIPGEEEVNETEPESCMAKDPIDSSNFPYTKARKSPGACTEKEADDIAAYFKKEVEADRDVLVSEWQKAVSANCAKCVFSDGTQTEWTPIISKDDALDTVNRGGCIEVLSGKESCGRAYQQVTECRLQACLQQCTAQREFEDCLGDSKAIFAGPCKGAYDTMEKECGTNLGAYENGCKGTTWTFEGPVKVMCVTGGAKD
jgi:hypothetical protein